MFLMLFNKIIFNRYFKYLNVRQSTMKTLIYHKANYTKSFLKIRNPNTLLTYEAYLMNYN